MNEDLATEQESVERGSERPYALDDLLAVVTKQNIHAEIANGEAVGEESW